MFKHLARPLNPRSLRELPGNLAPDRGRKSSGGQLWEIDENLMRAELGPAETATHLKRRKKLWQEKQRQEVSAQVEPKPQGGRPEGFAKDTESKTGTSNGRR